jgi:hypothetical protein
MFAICFLTRLAQIRKDIRASLRKIKRDSGVKISRVCKQENNWNICLEAITSSLKTWDNPNTLFQVYEEKNNIG